MKIPQETQKQIVKANAVIKCRDKAIESFWQKDRAIYYQLEYDKLLLKIKKSVYRIYPELYFSKKGWCWLETIGGEMEVFEGEWQNVDRVKLEDKELWP